MILDCRLRLLGAQVEVVFTRFSEVFDPSCASVSFPRILSPQKFAASRDTHEFGPFCYGGSCGKVELFVDAVFHHEALYRDELRSRACVLVKPDCDLDSMGLGRF